MTRVAVVTGSRADYGLLEPVMRAVGQHPALTLQVVVTGVHLLPPDHTARDVARAFPVAARIRMQRAAARSGRAEDALALGRGVRGLARWLVAERPDLAVVLGDRIEAFAAAAAASVAGIPVAHLHGGDRAEGVADEALRHAITKLAHLHLAASEASARRIVAMGEPADRVHVVGSPAIDVLAQTPALDVDRYEALGAPSLVVLLHPTGQPVETERTLARALIEACLRAASTLALDPNHDAGREGIVEAIAEAGCPRAGHLPRSDFIGLLRRCRVLVGNSSAGLIECAALGLPAVNIGPRQGGRERAGNVIDVPEIDAAAFDDVLARALVLGRLPVDHRYGDGHAGERAADAIAACQLGPSLIRKRNTY
jgi:UDP-hydrolysing UDP-N-acetyl-D-glucosamine 2-epimerase